MAQRLFLAKNVSRGDRRGAEVFHAEIAMTQRSGRRREIIINEITEDALGKSCQFCIQKAGHPNDTSQYSNRMVDFFGSVK
ncbi:hypothetical protein SDC9_55863 [bioreactor metagenome]|uniref:Uncharacterized protein n=1 Tax=bioreactor metagenome TaxID=1076179 RepID=A0A644X5H6_9ZZZZ